MRDVPLVRSHDHGRQPALKPARGKERRAKGSDLVRVLIVLGACLIAIGAYAYWCTYPPLPPSVHIWQETADSFSRHGKNVRRSIARALRGSDADVLDFIADARCTDGAGGYGFGDVLLTIAQELGDERFARILPQVPSDQRHRVWHLFKAGAEHRSHPLSDDELHRQLPKTAAILDEWQPKS